MSLAIDEYYEALEKFMRENERHPELIDPRNTPEREDIFGGNSTYSLFGRPRSQQTEPRFVCSFGYEGEDWKIHRMAPIICWDDSEHDMTRQMYGCFRCVDSQSDTVWARMDNSCT